MLMQLLDADYILNSNKPIVRLFGKTEQGNSVCAFYEGFKPYFYANKAVEGPEISSCEEVKKFVSIGFRQSPDTLFKITLNNPQDVSKVRERLEQSGVETFEADILFKYRFMVDKGLKGMGWLSVDGEKTFTKTVKCTAYNAKDVRPAEKKENCALRHLSFDIECIPADATKPLNSKKDPIVIIAVAFEPQYKNLDSLVLVAKPTSGRGIEGFVDEKEMLQAFLDIIDNYDPDIVTGYNINAFDVPYLLDRLEKNGLQKSFGRATDKSVYTQTFGMTQDCVIPGRIVVDPYQLIRRDPWVKFHRYDLNTVVKAMLGEEKHDVEYSDMPNLWKGSHEEMMKFIEYARKDAELALRLVLEKQLLDKFFELSKLSGVLLQDTFGGQSQRIEIMLLHEFRKRNYLMPTKPSKTKMARRLKERDKQGLQGATVLEPKKGLHADGCTLVLDFKSLYPSLMMGYNISPDTLILDRNEIECNVTPTGARFVKKEIREGILPYVLTQLLETRQLIKKSMKTAKGEERRILNAKQLAIKDISNSIYGYTGYVRARLYVIDVAASITAYGRENIEKTKKLVEENFPVEVVYGDSITKDRFVTIMDKSGRIMVKNIEELFEEEKTHAFVTADGKERIRLEGYKALTTNPQTKESQWADIKEIIRHKTNKKIYRVSQKFGETVVTEDHSLIVNDSLEEAKPLELNGRAIARVEVIPDVSEISSIDMYELIKDYSVSSIYKNRTKIAAVHKNNNFVWFGWENRKSPVKLKRFISADTPEMESLCRLLGAYISEGSSPKWSVRNGASIASSDTEWLARLQQDYAALFENTISSVIQSTKGMRELTYNSNHGSKTVLYQDTTHKLQMMNALAAVVFKMMCGQKSHNKRIPDFVFHLPRKYKLVLLENMIKGDGSRKFGGRYSSDYHKNNFRYHTKSLALASGLSLLLKQLCIRHTIDYGLKKKCYRITTCSDYNSNTKTRVVEETYDGYVYDLSVEGSHMFVDSCGQILLHNTDSLFVKTKLTNLDEARELGEKISKFVSSGLDGKLQLEFEKIYRTFLILTKKRYAGWRFSFDDGWKDEMEMKGIETIRRDWCLTGDTLIQMADGTLKPIADIPDKCSILTINPKTLKSHIDKSVAKTKQFSKILKITTDFIEIKATPEHKFFVFSDGKFQFKKSSELKKGEFIVQAKTIDLAGKPQKIGFEYPAKIGMKDVTIPTTTTPELCKIIGFIFGDGSVVAKKVTLYNQDLVLLEHYNKLFQNIFGVQGKLYNGNGCYNLVFFSKKLEMFFRHLGFNKKDKVPDIIQKVPNDQLAAFLKGYFDADGGLTINDKTASKNKSYLAVSFAANSKRVAEEVKLLLLRFGVWSSNLRFHRSLGTAYEFRLNCENARLFLERIGFTNKFADITKPAKLKGKTERLPLLREAKLLISKTGYAPTRFFRDTNQQCLTRSTAQSILDFTASNTIDNDEEFSQYSDILKTIINSDIAFTKIEKIEDAGEDVVYDIDTVETDTFLANGLLSHNCPLVSETMTAVLDTILKEGDVQRAIQQLKNVVEQLKRGEVPLEKLTVVKGITKSVESYEGMLPHIELAKKMSARNPEGVHVGDRLGFVIIKGNAILSKRAEEPAYVKKHKLPIDSDYYINSQLFPPIERILASLGITKSELLGGGRQYSLSDIMNGSKRVTKHEITLTYNNTTKQDVKETVLGGVEGFVCQKCQRSYRRIPLQGVCECGGELLIAYHGSVGKVVRK